MLIVDCAGKPGIEHVFVQHLFGFRSKLEAIHPRRRDVDGSVGFRGCLLRDPQARGQKNHCRIDDNSHSHQPHSLELTATSPRALENTWLSPYSFRSASSRSGDAAGSLASKNQDHFCCENISGAGTLPLSSTPTIFPAPSNESMPSLRKRGSTCVSLTLSASTYNSPGKKSGSTPFASGSNPGAAAVQTQIKLRTPT